MGESRLRRVARVALERLSGILPERTSPADCLVLSYHNVIRDDESVRGDSSLHLREVDFRTQLNVLRRHGTVVPLNDILVDRAPALAPRIAVTFDDAYRGAILRGLDICAESDIPATVFVAPGLLGEHAPWDLLADRGEWSAVQRKKFLWEDGGRLLEKGRAIRKSEGDSSSFIIATEADLSAAILQHSGLTFGNHTYSHLNLGAASLDVAVSDIQRAEQWLRERYPARALPVLAYPYGLQSPAAEHLSIVCKLAGAFLVEGGWIRNSNRASNMSLPRWNVPAGISLDGFRARLRGWFTNR